MTRGKQGQPAPGLSVQTGAKGRAAEGSAACPTPLGRKPSRVRRQGVLHAMHGDTTRRGPSYNNRKIGGKINTWRGKEEELMGLYSVRSAGDIVVVAVFITYTT